MPPPRGHKLCVCRLCEDGTEQDPDTLETVRGYYLSLKQYNIHNKHRAVASLRQETQSHKIPETAGPMTPREPNSSNIDKSVERPLQKSEDFSHSESMLTNYQVLLEQHVSAFKYPDRIDFISLSFESPFPTEFPLPDSSPFALHHDKSSSSNDTIRDFEEWLRDLYNAVKAVQTNLTHNLIQNRESLLFSIKEKQVEIHKFKAAQWEAQKKKLETRQKIIETNSGGGVGPIFVSTEAYLKQSYRFTDTQIIPILSWLLALTLHLLCHLSRDRSNWVLNMLIGILKQTLSLFVDPKQSHDKLLSSLPSDIRTTKAYTDFSPVITQYICCPKCRALYPQEHGVSLQSIESGTSEPAENPSIGETCTFQEVSQGSICNASLYRTRIVNDQTKQIPRMVYLHQDLPTWLARLLCRPGVQTKLRQSLDSISTSPKAVLRNIWDSPAISSFLGPDNKPFFRNTRSRLPLLFGIGFDSFNPFHNKQAGKKTSVGAIFMFCHNLPESIRYLPQYIYFVGAINGPTQPSLTQINHYFEILINQLETFYSRGYYLESTPESPDGLLVEGAVFPLIMDFHALRQATATASYNSRLFCIYCLLSLDYIDNVEPSKWPPWYSCEEHRSMAEAWLYAPTTSMREHLFEQNCVQWSPFLHLPYFQLDLMCMIEPMHAIQNVCKNLVRTTWGIDHKTDSGDGFFVGARPKVAKLTQPKELLNALNALKDKDSNRLLNARKGILYRICEMHELCRTAKTPILRDIIQKYYASAPDILAEDIERVQKALFENRVTPFKLRARLASSSEETRASDEKVLTRFSVSELTALCEELGITFGSKVKRRDMAEALLVHHFQSPVSIPSSDQSTGRSVIGADTIKELNKDIGRTILPSWISAGSNEFDSSQHGKLTAAEWRTVVLVRLAVTLPRLWIDGRKLEMLDNFMHLAGALVALSTRAVVIQPDHGKESTPDIFRREYQAYLEGRVKLYPTGKIQPTEHILYHIGDKLQHLGPVHPLSANIFEHLNGMLQDIPTNMRSGDIEKTYMRVFCMGSNLRAFIDMLTPEESSSTLNEILQDIKLAFKKTFRIETGSTMLQDVLSFEEDHFFYPHRSDLRSQHKAILKPYAQKPLWDFLEKRYRISALGIMQLSHTSTWSLPKARYRGIWYRRASDDTHGNQSHKDSHILVKAPNGERPYPCSIREILAYEHSFSPNNEPILEVLLLIRPYRSLKVHEQNYDPWARYPIAGGRLYSADLEKETKVISIQDIVGHFAKTPLVSGEIPQIKTACIHVLPLFWHNMFEWVEFLGNRV